eukprot:TRINITY_DN7113_c0_g1_i2.p2 TRINITY_DN7113_c0_g1~~TRINITY_DN7113_c0_g1_i2.p2  ORF type:complete len:101 (-),score=35.39 TRINITY_DN7113_c0_g1_i2:115-417(-)
MNARDSIIYCESIDRENKAREAWSATHGKELGLDKKKKKKHKEKPVRKDPAPKQEEEEEEEETRPLSLVYNQERYPRKHDLGVWMDRAVLSGYNKFNFRT